MRPRTIKVEANLYGMSFPIAEFLIAKINDIRKPKVELLCPQCNQRPTWKASYECACGFKTNHWSRLKRVVLGTGEEIVKTRLIEKKEIPVARAYVMPKKEFANYLDATLCEYGVIVKDANSASNLRKMLIAVDRLGYVIFLKFKDTYEERVAILQLSLSGRVILRELVPSNLLNVKETLTVDLNDVSKEEIEEAKRFIKMLPKVTDEKVFEVHDYRTIGLTEEVKPEKVVQLEAIIKKAKAKA